MPKKDPTPQDDNEVSSERFFELFGVEKSNYTGPKELDIPGILTYFKDTDWDNFNLKSLEEENPESLSLFSLYYFCHEVHMGAKNIENLFEKGILFFDTSSVDAYDFAYKHRIAEPIREKTLQEVDASKKVLSYLIPLDILEANGFKRSTEPVTEEEISMLKLLITRIELKLGLQKSVYWNRMYLENGYL